MSKSFSETQNFQGVKKTLLKDNNFKSIQQARREYPNLSDNEIYQNLFDFFIETNSEKRKRKEDKKNPKPKPEIIESKAVRFKTAAFEKKFTIINGLDSGYSTLRSIDKSYKDVETFVLQHPTKLNYIYYMYNKE